MREGKALLKRRATSPEHQGPSLCEETALMQQGLITHLELQPERRRRFEGGKMIGKKHIWQKIKDFPLIKYNHHK